MQPHCRGLNEHGLPYGLTPVEVNFFSSFGEECLQKHIERIRWGANQATCRPVYGPSKTPRLPQFVDLATNSGGMTPFFLLDNDAAESCANNTAKCNDDGEEQGQDKQLEGEKRQTRMRPPQGQVTEENNNNNNNNNMKEMAVLHAAQCAYVGMNTPQQQKRTLHVPFGTNTPSSAMGMTVSPAIGGRGMMHVTPASTIHTEIVSRALQQRTPAVVMVGGSNSLASELEIAFEEHTRKMNSKTKPNHQKQMDSSIHTADVDTTQSVDDTTSDSKKQRQQQRGSAPGRTERSTQRRNKESRHGKSKNKAQRLLQQENGNNNNNSNIIINSSLLPVPGSLPSSYEDPLCMNDNKKTFFLRIQCHGGRTTTSLSCTEYHVGDHVIFEADRGIDLGEVVFSEESTGEPLSTNPTTTTTNATNTDGFPAGDADVDSAAAKSVARSSVAHTLRPATAEEVDEWRSDLVEREAEAVAECRAACGELSLMIDVVGAAFQFDRKKLIFLYESDERVDFRALLQVMFSKFRCRIWMERINAPTTS